LRLEIEFHFGDAIALQTLVMGDGFALNEVDVTDQPSRGIDDLPHRSSSPARLVCVVRA